MFLLNFFYYFRIISFINEDPLATDLIGILREWGIVEESKKNLISCCFLVAHHIEQFYKVFIRINSKMNAMKNLVFFFPSRMIKRLK